MAKVLPEPAVQSNNLPRLRILLLGLAVVVATGGLGAGAAWRWAVWDVVRRRESRSLSVRELPDAIDLRSFLMGLVCLPVTWGGVLAFALPLLATSRTNPDPVPVVVGSLLVALALGTALAILYLMGASHAFGPESRATRFTRPWVGAWSRHFAGVAASAVTPGLLLCFAEPADDVLIVVGVVLAGVAPAAGAVVAIPTLAAAYDLRSAGERVRPLASGSTSLATVGLCLLWGAVGLQVVLPPPEAPLVGRDDFDAASCGAPGASLAPAAAEAILPGVVRTGWGPFVPAGTARIDGREVGWVTRWGDHGNQIVRIGVRPAAASPPLELSLDARSVVPLPTGLAVVEEEAGGSRAIVVVGVDLTRRARFALPPSTKDQTLLARDAGGGLIAAWEPIAPGRTRSSGILRWLHLRPDLSPAGQPRSIAIASIGPLSGSQARGRRCCIRVSSGPERILALEAGGRIAAPGSIERASARVGGYLWLLLVLAGIQVGLVLAALRAGSLSRALREGRLGREVWTGTLERVPGVLHVDGGEPVMLDAARSTQSILPEGVTSVRVTVLGKRSSTSSAAYRAATSRITASAVFDGDLAHALDLAHLAQRRALRRLVMVSWLILAPAVIALVAL